MRMPDNPRARRSTLLANALLFAGVAIAATPARAATTFVDPLGGDGNERCLIGPTCGGPGTAYNGEISIIHALELDAGISLVRVDDSFDQIWQTTVANGGQVFARGRYAAHTLELGFDAGSGYQSLVANGANGQILVTNPGMFSGAHASDFVAFSSDTSKWTKIPLSPSALFAFVLSDLSSGNKWTSNNSGSGVGASGYANSANGLDALKDHVVVFQDGPDHYFLAWEDLPLSSSDKDYNDMIVEVRFVTPVPLPAGGLLLASGLLGLGVLRLRAATRAPASA